jgi:hypothetical protein
MTKPRVEEITHVIHDPVQFTLGQRTFIFDISNKEIQTISLTWGSPACQ